mgnify:FL=1
MEKQKFNLRELIGQFRTFDFASYDLNCSSKRTAVYSAKKGNTLVTVWTNEYETEDGFITPLIKVKEKEKVDVTTEVYKSTTLEDILAAANTGEFCISQDRDHNILLKVSCCASAKVLETNEKGKPMFRYSITIDTFVPVKKYFNPKIIVSKINPYGPIFFNWKHDDFSDKITLENAGFAFVDEAVNALLESEEW